MIVFKGVLTVQNCFQDDRNLTDEMKKPLRHQQLEQKKIMLINHYRGSANVSYFYLKYCSKSLKKIIVLFYVCNQGLSGFGTLDIIQTL